MIDYPSGQDGAFLPARDTGIVPQEKLFMFWCFIPCNKSFIDQACPVKIACLWTSTSSRSINTQKKNETNQYTCYLPAGRSVLGKTVPEVLSTARGLIFTAAVSHRARAFDFSVK